MNILMLTDSMASGGAETHVLTLSKELASKNHRLTVASAGGTLAKRLSRFGIRHVTLPLGSHSPLDMLLCRAALRALLRTQKFDVVHSHSRLASLLVNDIAEKQGVPLVCTVHACFPLSPLRRRLSRWGDATIAVGEDLGQYLVDEYAVAPEKISVIPNGVDEKLFYPPTRSGTTPRIAFLSRLDGDCSLGAELLCRIAPRLCAEYPRLQIIIGGGGSELPRTKKLAHRANGSIGREAVVCVGRVCDAPRFMRSCDILVGVSRVAIEGAMCGASVVLCGNEGFLGELSEDNFRIALTTNFCARESERPSAVALYDSLARLLTLGERERKASAERVRALTLENCSASACAKKVCSFYKDARSLPRRENGGTLLFGYYGFGNMGDDALLRASIERARKEYPDVPIRALTKGGSRDSKNFGVRCACRHSPVSVLWHLADCDRLVFGGGTLLQCDTSRRSFFYYASLLLMAKAMGRERILWANGIGRIDGRLCGVMLKKALSGAQHLEVRDTRSLNTLKKMLCGERIYLSSDLAESKKSVCSTPERAEYLLRRAGLGDSKFVIAIPKARADKESVKELFQALKRLREGGNEILIIPLYKKQDLLLCKRLCSLLGAKILTDICFDDLRMLAERSDGVYSMRYHGLVAANLARAVFVGIGNDLRLCDYCNENNGKVL